jgi:hypothetical protein
VSFSLVKNAPSNPASVFSLTPPSLPHLFPSTPPLPSPGPCRYAGVIDLTKRLNNKHTTPGETQRAVTNVLV